MCGIAGILNSGPAVCGAEKRRSILERMGRSIKHRGPDSAGFWIDDRIGLVHQRLAIIDLEQGSQPLGNEDERVQVVFNGEIYNYRSLTQRLQSLGHRFRTQSDTEVLVHMYEEYAEEMVTHLRGMFAFAIWDRNQRKLLLARDRIGLKPLYYYQDSDRFAFASELKALLTLEGISKEIDLEALDQFLAFGFIAGERTIFKSIKKLAPAHTFTVSQRESSFETSLKRYWTLKPIVDESLDQDAWTEQITDKFQETVKTHLESDVPVGAFLSGGIDSAAIVAELSKSISSPVKTFTIGFSDQAVSEAPAARMLASHFQTDHTEEVISPKAAESLDDLVRYYDEPFADSSAIPTMAVSRLASQQVKVVMSGDGGDEAFGGYSRYVHDLRESRVRQWIPAVVRRSILNHLAEVWPNAAWLPRPARLKNTLTNLSLEPALAYANTVAVTRSVTRQQLMGGSADKLRGLLSAEELFASNYPLQSSGVLEAMTCTDIATVLPDGFLTKVDRASMAFGLEVRPPMVDHEFLEFAARIPGHWKIKSGQSKWIFRRALHGQLPDETLRGKKRGFEIPVNDWLRTDLREQFTDVVLATNSRIGTLVDQGFARSLYQQHLRGGARHGNTLWALLVLARWLEEYQPSIPATSFPASVQSIV